MAEDLRQQILGLYDDYLSADGKAVRYKAMAQDPRFWAYVDATAELQKVRGGRQGEGEGGGRGGIEWGYVNEGREKGGMQNFWGGGRFCYG